MKKILIIEDDKAIIRLLSLALKTNDYNVITAETGLDGIKQFLNENPDLILLDLGLPDQDGKTIIKQLREISNVPIIVISARDKEKEKIEALDNGANDYLTKPFNTGELLARIRVALRNNIKEDVEVAFKLDNFEIDFAKRKVLIDNTELHLTPIEFKLLALLVKKRGKVLTYTYLQKEIWGITSEDDNQSLRVFMASIRRKIEKDTNNPRFIITEVGVGYRFVDD